MPPTPLADRNPPRIRADLHHIAGAPVAGRGEEIRVTYPVTGETLVELRGADEAQLEAALAAARDSFDRGVWCERPTAERAAVLRAMADHLLARKDELVERILFDNGKTRGEAEIDVLAAVGSCVRNADYCEAAATRSHPEERGVEKIVRREPVGVVLGITPYNAPLMFTGLKACPPLAAGNSVVLKPSERAPIVPIALCEAAAAAGLPDGVLNLVQGGARQAARLACDPRVDMITITGGTAAGRAVMEAAAPTIKNLLLELGGKSAHVVLEDADLARAIPAIAAGIYRNAGQRCFSGSRLVVAEAVAEQVERGVAQIAAKLRVGDPWDDDIEVGPLIDERAVEAVEHFVERATDEGLRVSAGGERPAELAPGSFYRPTLLVGARRDSFAAQEEIFGPVLTVIRVGDAEEAIAVANDSRYGLAGGVWTRDRDRALEVARRVRTGYFWINTYGAVFGDVPFGGYRQSGLGREAGVGGYEAYTEEKTILIDSTGGNSAPVFKGDE